MIRTAALCGLIVLLAGCVKRQMIIDSEPRGALVNVNGTDVGATPVNVPSHLFLYYGHYDIRLFKDNLEPLYVKQAVPPPWYQYPVIDFVAENLVPWSISDRREFTYQLLPNRVVPPEELLRNADAQRGQGQLIQPAELPVETTIPSPP